MTVKFKVGDRVVRTIPCYIHEGPEKGAVGIVKKLELNYTIVRFDTPFLWYNQMHHTWPCAHNTLMLFDDTVNIPTLDISEVL